MKTLLLLEKSHHWWFLLGTSLAFLLLRLPSLFEPYWYGDEGIYQTIGLAVNHGRMLYTQIWDNKPPLLYILYALFAADQFTIRFVSMIVGIICIWMFYLLSYKLFTSLKIAYIITALFAFFFGIPLPEGNIANAENFMMLPILLAAYLTFEQRTSIAQIEQRKKSSFFIGFWLKLFSIGLLLSLAFLFKIVAVFDAASFFLFLLILSYKGKKYLHYQILHLLPFILGFLLPIAVTAFYFFIQGAFWDFYNGSFKQMVGYVGYGNTFIFSQGLLFIKLTFLALTILIIFLKRHVIPSGILFVYVWVAFSTFNAFFAQRPYTHYVLVLLPSFMLLIGTVPPLRTNLTTINKVGFVIALLILILSVKNFHFYQKTYRYYLNSVSFITGNKNASEYQRFFDGNTPKDYKLAAYINYRSHKNDDIFIWGNNAQLYKLTNKLPPGRYTVAYHMRANKNTLEETYHDLQRVQPRYIIITSVTYPIPFSSTSYRQKIMIRDAAVYERIF